MGYIDTQKLAETNLKQRRYAVYHKDNDEMYLMNGAELWVYLSKKTGFDLTYSVHTDGDTVLTYELSAGPNGKLGESHISHFFEDLGGDDFFIKEIIESKVAD